MDISCKQVADIFAEYQNLIKGPGCIYNVQLHKNTSDIMICRAIGTTVRVLRIHVNLDTCSLPQLEHMIRHQIKSINELES